MDKKVLIAAGLSFLVLLLYPHYLKKMGIQPSKRYAQIQPSKEANSTTTIVHDTVITHDTVAADAVQANDTVVDTVLDNNLLKLVINTRTGTVEKIYWKENGEGQALYSLKQKRLGLFSPTVSTVSFQSRSSSGNNEMVLKGQTAKRYYELKDNIFTAVFDGEKEIGFFIPTKYNFSYREARYVRMVIKSTSGPSYSMKPSKFMKKKQAIKNLDWFALSFRYRSLLFDPDNPVDIEVVPVPEQGGFVVKIKLEQAHFGIMTYLGPNSRDVVASYNQNWLGLLNYGYLNNVVKKLLEFFYKATGNYGWAIIILAVVFNLIFSPLTLKSQRSMKGMQKLQPEIQALKEKYKDNPQAINKEMLQLYKKHKVNPMGGCLPMFLQIPVFIALYNTLMRSYELKNAAFLWVKDLSEPDRLFVLAKSLPLIGSEINLLPILMAALMFVQQKFTSVAKAPGQGPSMNLWFLPIIFGIIFYKFPAGLVLYWFTNSLFMLALQTVKK